MAQCVTVGQNSPVITGVQSDIFHCLEPLQRCNKCANGCLFISNNFCLSALASYLTP